MPGEYLDNPGGCQGIRKMSKCFAVAESSPESCPEVGSRFLLLLVIFLVKSLFSRKFELARPRG